MDADAQEQALAIVGMAGRFPGARDVDAYWRNLRDGVESIRRYTREELEAEGVPTSQHADPAYVPAGAPLEAMERFDASFFGLSPLDASILDPQHRHFLECCWEALESAAVDPARFPGAIGVFGGSGHNAYLPYNLLTNPALVEQVGFFLLRHTGNDKDFLTTRVSYAFDLRGPSVTVQTACSTSLVAVHLAGQSLLARECDLALAGGVTIELPHRRGYRYAEGEILAPDGHCRPFDAAAAGTVFGSAAGVVALRRLNDALADGDPILAVIRGSAINNDGSGKIGYLAPSVDGQAEAIAEAVSVADVPIESIRYVEAHGTGTAVGDPIEVAALSQAFATQSPERGFCALGSVKSNIGHCDTAAGVASLIKVVQALRHGELPPTLHYRAPNAAIDFDASPFFVNDTLRPFEPAPGEPRRAGVSSLGVGGTNAHVVLEEAPERPVSGASDTAWQILPLSARSGEAAQAAAERLAGHLRAHPEESPADVAWTLQTGRRGFEERRVAIGRSADECIDALESEAHGALCAGRALDATPSVAFLFPGGGAPYPGMGKDLYAGEPVYRDCIDAGLGGLPDEPAAAIRRLLLDPPADATAAAAAALELERPSLQLPALFLTELALAKLWRSWGIEPTALAGHSVGENTAACLAGVFRFEDALALVHLRGRLFEQVPAGGMLSVPLAAEALEPRLGADLDLGAVNAAELCIASGPRAALDALTTRLAGDGVETRPVRIAIAAHSRMLEPILGEWREFLRGLTLSPPQIPFVSNLTGTWIRDDEATDPEYWVRHLRSPVRFADGLSALTEEPNRVFLEVGPGHGLSSLARIGASPDARIFASMRRAEEATPDDLRVRRSLGDLWCAGVEPDWSALHGPAPGPRRRLRLPTYPWQHQRHWIEPGSAWGASAATDPLTRLDDVADWFRQPVWRRAPLVPGRSPEGVVVLGDPDGLGSALVRRLRGGRVVFVTPGDRFTRLGEDRYELVTSRADDWSALVADLCERGPLPEEWVHLLAAGAPEPDSEALDGLARHTADSFDSLLFLGRALALNDPESPLQLRVVTRGSQQIGGEPVPAPLGALALGPVRVLPREISDLCGQAIDLEAGDADAEATADRLVAEIGAGRVSETTAWRGGQRFVQRHEPVRLDRAPDPHPALRERGVYLVTGGFGGLGRVAANHLAERVQARLVLVGREGLPPRDTWGRRLQAEDDATARAIRGVQAMEAAGAEVLPLAADVTDCHAMEEVLATARDRFGEIHGVIHAAGTLDDGLVANKTQESAAAVLAPKVQGTLVLDRVLGDTPLDFFVMYSSVSALAGLAGQVDYTAANAFLDAFATARSQRDGGASRSLAWSAWQQVGMAAERALELGVAASGGADLPAPAHPLLDRCLVREAGRTAFSSAFSPEQRWVLDEHRLRDGPALLPGTGFLELVRAAFESPSQDRVVEIRDALFLAPFAVPDGETREIRVELTGAGDASSFSVLSPADPEDETAVVEHACGEIAYTDAHAPPVQDLEALRSRCQRQSEEVDGLRFQGHLAFGRRWDVLRRIHWGEGEAFLTLELEPSQREDLDEYLLHPALLDMATAGAQALVPGNENESALFIPVSYGKLTLWRALESRIHSHVIHRGTPDGAGDDFAAFDVTLYDDGGRTLGVIESFVMKRIDDPASLDPVDAGRRAVVHRKAAGSAPGEALHGAAAAPPVLAHLHQAILPAEGLDALDRALAVTGLPQLTVSSLDLDAWIAEVTEPAEPAGAAPEPREIELDPELLGGLREIETALGSHPAVRQSAAMAFADRPGRRRLAAYWVPDPDQDATASELRRHLRKSLAEDWIPASFVELDALPETAEGELDRRALPDPFGGSDEVAPRTETERALATVWCEVLGLDRVGAHDNFFDLGGHSLLAMRAITRLHKRLGVKLDNAIMVLQTLEQIAAECDRRLGKTPGTAPDNTPGASTGAASSGSRVPAATDEDAPGPDDRVPPGGGLGRRLLRAVKGRGS